MSLREKIQILVVDDMSTSRGLIVQALESFGIVHVRHAANGHEAMAAIAAQPVHLVISDYNMPGMDGIGLLHQLRREPQTSRVGFILITGRANSELVESGRALGMNNFITKPFTAAQLKSCLEAVVGRI